MAEHPNVARIRAGYAAFSSGDFAALNDLFADDIVWHVGGRHQLARDYRGRDEVYGLFGKLAELTGGTSRIEVHAILADDDHAAVLIVSTATRDGRHFQTNDAHICHLRDGKVVEFWATSTDPYAADELFGR